MLCTYFCILDTCHMNSMFNYMLSHMYTCAGCNTLGLCLTNGLLASPDTMQILITTCCVHLHVWCCRRACTRACMHFHPDGSHVSIWLKKQQELRQHRLRALYCPCAFGTLRTVGLKCWCASKERGGLFSLCLLQLHTLVQTTRATWDK